MAQTGPVVGLVGWQALRRDLVRMASDSGELRAAMKQAGMMAALPVAMEARSMLPSGRPSDTKGRLASTVRVTGTYSGATVRMGSAAVPWAGWVEFGGTRQDPFESSRPFYSGGRYLFPAARRLAATAGQIYTDRIGRVLEEAGVWTNPSSDPEAIHD